MLVLLVNDLSGEFFFGCCVADVKNLASVCEYLGEAALADLFNDLVLFFEVKLHGVFSQLCPEIMPEGCVREEEVTLFAAITQEEQVSIALQAQPLCIYVLECTIPPVFLIGLALEVEEVPLCVADVAGSFEAEGSSNFDVLIAFSQDFFVGDGGVLSLFDPQEPLLCECGGGEQGRDFVNHF